ncbi:SDR family NAD(P)-dependent oxidoreductase [Micromonospora sp. NPDC005113]
MSEGIAVVTGSASGVGAATVARLQRRGWRVVGVDVQESGDGDAYVRGSVGELATWERVRATAGEELDGPPTVVVFAAAVLHTGSVLELDPGQWREIFTVNVDGVFHGLRTLLPGMVEAGGGSIVTVASVDAFMAEQGLAAYCASKGALLQLTRCVAMDHARQNVRANCVAPGVIDTPFFRRHLDTASDPARFLRAREQRNPLGRLLQPDEVAATVEFAALDAVGMTGSILTVDAGLSASFDFRTGEEGS